MKCCLYQLIFRWWSEEIFQLYSDCKSTLYKPWQDLSTSLPFVAGLKDKFCWQELGCCFSDTLANFGHIPFPLSRWRSATPSSWRGSTVMGSRAVGRPLSWWASFSNAHHSLKVLEFLYAYNFFSLIIHDITQHRLQLSWFGGLFHNIDASTSNYMQRSPKWNSAVC